MSSRNSGASCFESLSLRWRKRSGKITAAATTGPAKAPRPASSTPAIRTTPTARSFFSYRKPQRRYIPAENTETLKSGKAEILAWRDDLFVVRLFGNRRVRFGSGSHDVHNGRQ